MVYECVQRLLLHPAKGQLLLTMSSMSGGDPSEPDAHVGIPILTGTGCSADWSKKDEDRMPNREALSILYYDQ